MNEYRLVLQPEAESDLKSAYAWYEGQRKGLGLQFMEAVEDALQQVLRMPTVFAETYRGCRQCAVRRFPYIIHYLLQDDHVSVVAILHGHRDPSLWQDRVDDSIDGNN